jgi:hypothetical protein
MTGTRSKGTEDLLKVAIALCIFFSLTNFIGMAYEHVPPYKVGECFSAPKQGVIGKIVSNHILQGYSEVSATSEVATKNGPVGFTELRHPSFKPVECPK